MASLHPLFSRWMVVCLFVAIASSAGLQWAGLREQSEASRQLQARRSVDQFSSLLTRYEIAPAKERPAAAEDLRGFAERLPETARVEPVATVSRRVQALASYSSLSDQPGMLVQERLRAEIQDLVHKAESLESRSLDRAERLQRANQALLLGILAACGFLLFAVRRQAKPEG